MKSSGPDGINRVVDKFVLKHPSIARRQIEIRINDISIKEKRADDVKQVWHIKDDYAKYLTMENFGSEDTGVTANLFEKVEKSNPSSSGGASGGSATKRKKPDTSTTEGATGVSESTPAPNKKKSSSSKSAGGSTTPGNAEAAVTGGELNTQKSDDSEMFASAGSILTD